MHLNDVSIFVDDYETEQKHIEIVFYFNKEGDTNYYEYSMLFHSGMPLEDFKNFIKTIGKVIDSSDPLITNTGDTWGYEKTNS